MHVEGLETPDSEVRDERKEMGGRIGEGECWGGGCWNGLGGLG